MKTKLLKKLRAIGRCMINIHSVTTCGVTVTGMKYGYNHNEYAKMFNYGDTEKDMLLIRGISKERVYDVNFDKPLSEIETIYEIVKSN